MTETATAPETEALAPAPDVAAGPPPAPDGRPGLLKIGALVGGSAVSMLFLGLAGAYLSLRDAEGFGPDTGDLPNLATAVLTGGLLMSAITAVWVAHSAVRGDRRGVNWALGLTGVLAAAHVNGMTFVWSAIGQPAASSDWATMMFAMTGLHWALTVLGLAAVLALLVRSLGGQLVNRAAEAAVAFAIGWQFLVGAWFLVYVLVFLVK